MAGERENEGRIERMKKEHVGSGERGKGRDGRREGRRGTRRISKRGTHPRTTMNLWESDG